MWLVLLLIDFRRVSYQTCRIQSYLLNSCLHNRIPCFSLSEPPLRHINSLSIDSVKRCDLYFYWLKCVYSYSAGSGHTSKFYLHMTGCEVSVFLNILYVLLTDYTRDSCMRNNLFQRSLHSLQNQEVLTVCFLMFQQRVQRPLLCFSRPVLPSSTGILVGNWCKGRGRIVPAPRPALFWLQ